MEASKHAGLLGERLWAQPRCVMWASPCTVVPGPQHISMRHFEGSQQANGQLLLLLHARCERWRGCLTGTPHCTSDGGRNQGQQSSWPGGTGATNRTGFAPPCLLCVLDKQAAQVQTGAPQALPLPPCCGRSCGPRERPTPRIPPPAAGSSCHWWLASVWGQIQHAAVLQPWSL